MIKLTLERPFKSLNSIDIELPDFTVLTGLNGTGKTHTLSGIAERKIVVQDEEGKPVGRIQYVTHETLIPQDDEKAIRDSIKDSAQNLWDLYSKQLEDIKSGKATQLSHSFTNKNDRSGDFNPEFLLIKSIAEKANKHFHNINANDIFTYYPINDTYTQTNILYQNLSKVFKSYYDRYQENKFNKFRNKEEGDDSVKFLTDEQFISEYGPEPWAIVNDIFNFTNLDYIVNSPKENRDGVPFELQLTNKINGAKIKFSDLSSGEKTLMSLVLILYNLDAGMTFPKVILMDEPDASLHPEMSKVFIEIVYNMLVLGIGVKVIITTHSPSTVAFSPEESIFVMNKNEPRIEKTTKDIALKVLSTGVPSFSINYENRRQVFVESNNDVKFYERLYGKLSYMLQPEISLNFISSGDSRTNKHGIPVENSDQVKTITNSLRKSGNKFVWGIVDFDKKNTEKDSVMVLGNGSRYSIESYIFDPILVSALLLKEKIITGKDLELPNNKDNYLIFNKLNEKQLQKITNLYIDKLSHYVKKKEDESIKPVFLINGMKINLPNWYLLHQGHELEEIIVNAFPLLDDIKKKKEDLLKLEILDKIVDVMPQLVDVEILNIFKNIQSI